MPKKKKCSPHFLASLVCSRELQRKVWYSIPGRVGRYFILLSPRRFRILESRTLTPKLMLS